MSQQTKKQSQESQSASLTNSRAGNFDPPKNAALSQALGLTGPYDIPLVDNKSEKGKSWILRVGYRPSTKQLVVETKPAYYVYTSVPADIGSTAVWEAREEERSAGKFYNEFIKGKYVEEKILKDGSAPKAEKKPSLLITDDVDDDPADFFRKLPAGEYEARKNAEINEVIQRAGVQVVAADTLGAMETLESDPTDENFQKLGESLDKSIEFLDELDALPEIPNLPVDDEEDRQAKKNPVTGWTHYPSGVSPAFDTEQDDVCDEPPDTEPVTETCYTCGKSFDVHWSEVATPIGGKPICTSCWDKGEGRNDAPTPIVAELIGSVPVELPTDKISTILKRANISQEAIAAIRENFSLELGPNWKKASLAIVVADESETGLMKAAREMRLALKKERLRIENTRKTLKESSLRTGQAIDAVAKYLKEEIEPVEKHLEAQEKFAELAQLKRESELRTKRAQELSHFDVQVESLPLGTMDDDTYQIFKATAERQSIERKAAAEKKEADRIADENRQREENEKLRQDNARILAEKAESDRKAKEAQDELDRQARQKDEAERYAAALKIQKQEAPDVEKLRVLATFLDDGIEYPECADATCYMLVQAARHSVESAATELRRQVEVLCKK